MANVVWGSTLLAVAAIVVLLNWGAPSSWDNVGVQTMAPQWADSHAITRDAECRAQGIDPWTPNSCNEGHVPNYPRVWLTIADLLGRSTGLLATVCSGIFLVGLAVAFGTVRPAPIAVAAFVLASLGPPAMLAFERGNIELAIIGLVAIAGLALARRELAAFVIGTALIGVTALLKIYTAPLFIVPVLVAFARPGLPAQKRARVVIAGAIATAVGVLLLLQWNDIQRIEDTVPRPSTYAYGARTFVGFIQDDGFRSIWETGAAYYVGVVAVLAFVVWRSLRPPRPARRPSIGAVASTVISTPEGVLLLSGTVLFATSFFFANYTYRLLVLSLLLPACAVVLQGRGDAAPRAMRSAVALVVAIVAIGCASTLEIHLEAPVLGLATNLTMVASVAVLVCAVSLAVGLAAPDVAPRDSARAGDLSEVPSADDGTQAMKYFASG